MPLEYTLRKYQKNKRELALIDASLDRMSTKLSEVAIVSGKVTKSSDDFPYIEEHISVEMAEPREADRIRKKIAEKEVRRSEVVQEMLEVEEYIERMPDSMDKQIFEMVFLDGMTQEEVGKLTGYTQARVSQIVRSAIEDL